jgi:hypothetical protein
MPASMEFTFGETVLVRGELCMVLNRSEWVFFDAGTILTAPTIPGYTVMPIDNPQEKLRVRADQIEARVA